MVIKDKNEIIKSERNDIEEKFTNLKKLKEIEYKEYESKVLL